MAKIIKKYPLTPINFKFIVDNYRNDLIGFIEDVLQFHKLNDWQVCLCEGIMKGDRKIAVKSCTGSGKSSLMSCVALWKILVFYDSRVVVTSASYAQLSAGFIFAVRSIVNESIIPDWFICTNDSVTVNGLVGNSISFVNWSINQYERIAGTHSTNLLWIADEASSYPSGVFEAMDGNLQTLGSQQVLISNPTRREGKIYDIFTKTNTWLKFTISAYDVPHLVNGPFIRDSIESYGVDSDQYKIRVMGEFPESSVGSFISEDLVTSALNRVNTRDPFEKVIAGLDIADGGDDTVLAIRQGLYVEHMYLTCDIDNIADEIIPILIKYNVHTIFVDSNGVGRNTYKRLMKLRENVFPVVFGKCKSTELACSNRRTLYWWRFREWCNKGQIVSDEPGKLRREAASLLYTYDNLNRYNLENKDAAKSRAGVNSPDIIDAIAYTFCDESNKITVTFNKSQPIIPTGSFI